MSSRSASTSNSAPLRHSVRLAKKQKPVSYAPPAVSKAEFTTYVSQSIERNEFLMNNCTPTLARSITQLSNISDLFEFLCENATHMGTDRFFDVINEKRIELSALVDGNKWMSKPEYRNKARKFKSICERLRLTMRGLLEAKLAACI